MALPAALEPIGLALAMQPQEVPFEVKVWDAVLEQDPTPIRRNAERAVGCVLNDETKRGTGT
jgi:hypothetical protein